MDTETSGIGLKLQRHRQGGSDGKRVNKDSRLPTLHFIIRRFDEPSLLANSFRFRV
jgi:hypothetical protein